MKNKRKKLLLRLLGGFIIVACLSGITVFYVLYHHVYEPNVDLRGRDNILIDIPTGSNYDDVVEILSEKEILTNKATFDRMARKKNYINRVRSGRYMITDSMSNNELINMLRSGRQVPVKVTFNNIRTPAQLAGSLSQSIEADSLSIISLLNDSQTAKSFGFDLHTFPLMFIPNTYELYWNTTAEKLFERMHDEYKRYWNRKRLEKAENVNLTPVQAGILASIVQLETNKSDEMSRIAGVYINRLQRNIPLQADPTVVYALGDFTINRVLSKHLEIDSPYNTYLNKGLPPGPISLPPPDVIEKVLNYEQHEYIFFCARDDFSGYHSFASTYAEHLANARRYQKALNENKIMR